MKISNRTILKHFAYWILFILFFGTLYGIRYENFASAFTREISIMPGRIFAVYFIIYFLIPRYIPKKKYILFALATLLTLIVSGIVQRIFFHLIYYPLFVPRNIASPLWHFFNIMDEIMSINTALIVPLTYKLMKYWQNEEIQKQNLAREKMEAELAALKNQINPHFLFNTLNNIYGLSLQKSGKLPGIILKLSDILHYLLYETNDLFVPLSKELKILNDYVELQKIRYSADVSINFRTEIRNEDIEIPPLLFLPLVENCFKHGLSKQVKNKILDILIKTDDTNLSFRAENSIPAKQNTKKDERNHGIGIKNLTSRLEMIYPGSYRLSIHENDHFVVELKINLSQHDRL